MTNPAVKSLESSDVDWFGTLDRKHVGQYIDAALLLVFGGIPWQEYFQRVLSTKSVLRAQVLSYVAAVGCVIMSIPSILIGMVAKAAAWNETTYAGTIPIPPEETKMVLPLVLQYLTPQVVAFFGLGAVSAAVMSSADSSMLGATCMFARNVYRLCFRSQASEREIIWVMRVSTFVIGGLATSMALTIPTIYGLWYLCADLVYVVLFPQLVCVVHLRNHCNTYGSLSAYIIGLLLRILGGEPIIHLPAVVHYPWYDEEDGQLFPFRTLAMLVSFVTLLLVSWFTKWIFENSYLPAKFDVFHCIVNVKIPDILHDQELRENKTTWDGQDNPALSTDEHGVGDSSGLPSASVHQRTRAISR